MEIKMIKTGYYTKQQDKLVKTFKKTLKQYEPRLSAQYGEEFTKTINTITSKGGGIRYWVVWWIKVDKISFFRCGNC